MGAYFIRWWAWSSKPRETWRLCSYALDIEVAKCFAALHKHYTSDTPHILHTSPKTPLHQSVFVISITCQACFSIPSEMPKAGHCRHAKLELPQTKHGQCKTCKDSCNQSSGRLSRAYELGACPALCFPRRRPLGARVNRVCAASGRYPISEHAGGSFHDHRQRARRLHSLPNALTRQHHGQVSGARSPGCWPCRVTAS